MMMTVYPCMTNDDDRYTGTLRIFETVRELSRAEWLMIWTNAHGSHSS